MRFLRRRDFTTLGLALLSQMAGWAAPHILISENTTVIPVPIGELRLTESVIQDGPLSINRFRMHRLRRPNIIPRGSILLLPGLGNNFNGFLTGDGGDITKSFAGYLARLGYDVFGYSPRETGIAGGACAAGLDCSPALQWSMQTVIDDVTFIRGKMGTLSPGKLPVVAGFSLGAATALAVVNQNPKAYSGLLAWEGSLVTDDPAIRAHAQGFCTQFEGMLAAGVAVDDQSLPFVKTVNQFALGSPNAPFVLPVPGFPPGLTNRQALLLILTTPNPIAPSPRPGFITAAGDFMAGTLTHSDLARLQANIAAFNDVTANRVTRDFYCSLAGNAPQYSSNLAAFKAPVLILQAGQGFGPIMTELPTKLGSTNVTFHGIHNYAHVDHLGSNHHLFVLEGRVAQWLNQVFD